MVSHRVLQESVRGKFIVWYPGGLWARPFSPNPTRKESSQLSRFRAKLGGPLGRPCVENARGMSWEMSADTTDVLSADTTDVLSADTFPSDFAPPSPKWFSAITCNIWLRLECRPLDSAWFFNTEVWYFRPWNPFLTPWIPDLDPGGFCLGWGRVLSKKGVPENMILWWKWSPMRPCGDLYEGFGLYGTQEAFGQARFPPNPFKK